MVFKKYLLAFVCVLAFNTGLHSECARFVTEDERFYSIEIAHEISSILQKLNGLPALESLTQEQVKDKFALCILTAKSIDLVGFILQKYPYQAPQMLIDIENRALEQAQAYTLLVMPHYADPSEYWNDVLAAAECEKLANAAFVIFERDYAYFDSKFVCGFLEDAVNECWASGIQIAVTALKRRSFDTVAFLNRTSGTGHTLLYDFIMANANRLVAHDPADFDEFNDTCVTLVLSGARADEILSYENNPDPCMANVYAYYSRLLNILPE